MLFKGKKSKASHQIIGEDLSLMSTVYQQEMRLLLDGAGARNIIEAEELGYDLASDTSDINKFQDNKATPIQELIANLQDSKTLQQGAEFEVVNVVVIDSTLYDKQVLTNNLANNVAVLYLDPDKDGLVQIEAFLQSLPKARSLHIITHGKRGEIELGNVSLDFSSLTSSQESLLTRIGTKLQSDGDILIYGCKFAEGEVGRSAVETLSRLTKADVAASDDTTGTSGDWDLEFKVGKISDDDVFKDTDLSEFKEDLARDFIDGASLSKASVVSYFDGAEKGSLPFLYRQSGSGYADIKYAPSTKTPTSNVDYKPDFRNGDVMVDKDSEAFVLLTKDKFDLNVEKVTIIYRVVSSTSSRTAAVFGLVKGDVGIDSIPWGGAGDKSIGMIGNFAGGTENLNGISRTGSYIRSRHIASVSSFLEESWDWSNPPYDPGYTAMVPQTTARPYPGLSVIKGETQGYLSATGVRQYKNLDVSKLPENYYSSKYLIQGYVRIILFKQDNNYYMRLQSPTGSSTNLPTSDSGWKDLDSGYNNGREALAAQTKAGGNNIYDNNIGIKLNVSGITGFGDLKLFFALGADTGVSTSAWLEYLTVNVEDANYSPEFIGASPEIVANALIDSSGSAPSSSFDGIDVKTLLSNKASDKEGNKIGIAILDFGSDYDSSKHKIFVGTHDSTGSFNGWTELTNSMLSGDNAYVLGENDRIYLISTDVADRTNSNKENFLQFNLWDAFTGNQGQQSISAADLAKQRNSAYSNVGGDHSDPGTSNLKASFTASGQNVQILRSAYYALNAIGNPNDDIELTRKKINIEDLKGSMSGSSYDLYYIIVLNQAVSLSANANTFFVVTGGSKTSGMFINPSVSQATWTYKVTVGDEYEGEVSLGIKDVNLFLSKGGKALTSTALSNAVKDLDLKAPTVSLAQSSISIDENNALPNIAIQGETGLNHEIFDISVPNKNAKSAFRIVNNNLTSNGDLDYETFFTNTSTSSFVVTIKSTDAFDNATLTDFTLTLTNVVEDKPPTQTKVTDLTLQEDQAAGIVIPFSALNLTDTDEFGMVATTPSGFFDIQITAIPIGGKIVRVVGGKVLETYDVNDHILMTDINSNNIFYIPNKDYNNSAANIDSLSFRSSDTKMNYSPIDQYVNFIVSPINDIPESTGSSLISVVRGSTYVFSLTDFSKLYMDVEDGTTPNGIVISMVTPGVSQGDILFNNRTVILNSAIPNATDLTFVSKPTSTGSFVFEWYGVDNDGEKSTKHATITINLTSDPNPPRIGNVTLTASEDTPFTNFPQNESGYSFSDVDGDKFYAIVIKSLPKDHKGMSSGTLLLGSKTMTVGSIVGSSLLVSLTYVPTLDFTQTTTIEYNALNDKGASSSARRILIEVQDADDPITTGDTTLSLVEDKSKTLVVSDFIYSDPDDPINVDMTVTFSGLSSLASSGRFELNGNAINDGTEISYNQIASGALVFVPVPQYSGQRVISYGVANDGASKPRPSDFTITVSPENDLPYSQDKLIKLSEDQPTDYVLQIDLRNQGNVASNDFLFVDDDIGDVFEKVIISSGPDAKIGMLYLHNNPLSSSVTELTANDIANLKFVLTKNAFGTTSMVYRVENSKAEQSLSLYTITFQVDSVDDPPVLTNNPVINVDQNKVATYGSQAFEFMYSDEEGDLVSHVKWVTQIPVSQGGFFVQSARQTASTKLTDFRALEFKPNRQFSGLIEVSFRLVSSNNTESSVYTLTINVNDIADAPEGKDISRTTNEDVDYLFNINLATTTAADMDFYYYDPDGDSLGGILIATSPTGRLGELLLNGQTVSIGQEVVVSDLSSLSFQPLADQSGSTSFTYRLFSGTGANRMFSDLIVFSLDVLEINDKPIITNTPRIVTTEDTAVSYGKKDFVFKYLDKEGVKLDRIELERILDPNVGTFMLGSSIVSGTTIKASDLNRLVFVPTQNYSGQSTFKIRAYSADVRPNQDSVSEYIDVIIEVGDVDDKPISSNKTVTFIEDSDYTFTLPSSNLTPQNSDFYYFDQEGAIFGGVVISSIPRSGEGFLVDTTTNTTITIANTKIPANNINSLVFRPVKDFYGTVTFGFRVEVDTGQSSTSEPISDQFVMTLVVTPVNDAPVITNNPEITTDEDMPLAYGDKKFIFVYSDVEGSALDAIVFDVPIPSTFGRFEVGGNIITGKEISGQQIRGGTLHFVPAASYSGNSSFTYRVRSSDSDSKLSDALYTLTITVNPIDDIPTTMNRDRTVHEDQKYSFKYNANNPGDTTTNNDFVFNDEEAEVFKEIRLISRPDPTLGYLELNGQALSLNMNVISVRDLNNLVFVTEKDQNGVASFQFVVVDDGSALSAESNMAEFNITIIEVNDKPYLENADPRISTDERTAARYTIDNFTFSYADQENTPLDAIVFANSLPSSIGGFYFEGQLIIGKELSSNVLSNKLEFRPNVTFIGNTSLLFQLRDADGDLSKTYTFQIAVASVDDVPETTDRTRTIQEDTEYKFKITAGSPQNRGANNDFVFDDRGENEQFGGVKIEDLPLTNQGALLLNGVAVTSGQEISVRQIPRLVFKPAADVTGEAKFSFRVYERTTDPSTKYSLLHAFIFTIASVEDAPEITRAAGLSISLLEKETIKYGDKGFQINYKDADNDPWVAIEFDKIPDRAVGVFQIGGANIKSRVVSVGDLANLNFVAGTGQHINVLIKVRVVNDNGASKWYDIIVNIGDVDDRPVGTDITTSINEDDPLTFGDFRTKLLASYSDDERQPLSAIIIDKIFDASFGTLMHNKIKVSSGQKISVNDISLLTFEYSPGYEPGKVGTVTQYITYRLVNTVQNRMQDNMQLPEDQESLVSYKLNVEIMTIDDKPQSKDFITTIDEEGTLTYGRNGFNIEYTDSDDPNPKNYTVSFLNIPDPTTGTFYLIGGRSGSSTDRMIMSGDTADGYELARLRFVGADQYHGTFKIAYNIFNQTLGTQANYEGIFVVNSVPDAPSSSPNTVTLFEGSTYSFSYFDTAPSDPNALQKTDFLFNDPESGDFKGIYISSTNPFVGQGILMLGTATLTGTDIYISKDDLNMKGLVFVANQYNEDDVTFSFQVAADRMNDFKSLEQEFVIDIIPQDNQPAVTKSPEYTVNEDQSQNVLLSDFVIFEPDQLDTETMFVITRPPISSEGALVYGTQTIAGGTTLTIEQGVKFSERLTFVPAENFNTPLDANGDAISPVIIKYKVITGDAIKSKESTEEQIVITVIPQDDKIGAQAIVKTGTEGKPVQFAATDFLRPNMQPNDPDVGEDLGYILFNKVPSVVEGYFLDGTTTLIDGATIDAANLDKLKFIPADFYDQIITTSYTVVSTKGVHADRYYSLEIQLTPVDNNPDVKNVPMLKVEAGISTSIDPKLFTDEFFDVDTGDSIKGVVFLGQPDPSIGKYTFQGADLAISTTILTEDLEHLVFVPAGIKGDASFDFVLLDQSENRSQVTKFQVDVEVDPNLPVTGGRTVYLPSNRVYSFNELQFPFSDADGDKYLGVKFTNVPKRGIFYVYDDANDVKIIIKPGELIAKDQLSKIKYSLDDGIDNYAPGQEEVLFKVVNDRNAVSAAVTLTIVIIDSAQLPPTPIDPPGIPLTNDPSKLNVQIDAGFVYDLKSKITDIFVDPEGDELEVISVTGLAGSGLVYNVTTGVISGSPGLMNAGRYDVTVKVKDKFGGEAEQVFDLIVSSLLLELPGKDESDFVISGDLIKKIDQENLLPKVFTESLFITKLNTLSSVDIFDKDVNVFDRVNNEILGNSESEITGYTINVKEGKDFGLITLILGNKDGKKGIPFTLAIKLSEPSKKFIPLTPDVKDINLPTLHASQFTATELNGFTASGRISSNTRATSDYLSQKYQQNDINPLGSLESRNSAGFVLDRVSSRASQGVELPGYLRQSTSQGDYGSEKSGLSARAGTQAEVKSLKISERTGDEESKVATASSRYGDFIDRIQKIVQRPVNDLHRSALEIVRQGAASGTIVGSAGDRVRDEFHTRSERSFFSKRPVDRLITAALQRQAGDIYTPPLPDADQSGSSLNLILGGSNSPIVKAVKGITPKFNERASSFLRTPIAERGLTPDAIPEVQITPRRSEINTPGVDAANPGQGQDVAGTLRDGLGKIEEKEPKEPQDLSKAKRIETDRQKIVNPETEQLDIAPDGQREEFLKGLIELLKEQKDDSNEDNNQQQQDAETLESRQRLQELDLLNRLIRGR